MVYVSDLPSMDGKKLRRGSEFPVKIDRSRQPARCAPFRQDPLTLVQFNQPA
jgi:hypothetical protein